jgi:hypothetical protein
MPKEIEDIEAKIQDKVLDNFPIVEDAMQIEVTVLMPELEALVKKNPNKLIGCGG